MAYANTYMRQEIKYLLTPQQKRLLLESLYDYITEDKYSNQTISSLYCDSDEDILIRTSLEKPYYREKLRLRAYGTPNDNSRVYLEIKKKCGGTVYKRRAKMTCLEAYEYLENGIMPTLPDYVNRQVMSEIDFLAKRDGLKPRVLISYDRQAFYANDNEELRLTFDGNVRYRTENLDVRQGTQGILLANQPFGIMEIKSAAGIPLWLCGVLSKLEIYPGSFSKYGAVYKEKLSERDKIIIIGTEKQYV